MRLLDTSTFELREFYDGDIPGYAILSHRWEAEEVSFRELQDGSGKRLHGWLKIERFCAIAHSNDFKYVWIDTCCIDKSSSAELSEAINSMFRWYQGSEICYAYLSDVLTKDKDRNAVRRAFGASKWFTRGWTLQELLAPDEVVFFDQEWVRIGTTGSRIEHKDREDSLLERILAVTGIQRLDFLNPRGASVAKRMSWASKRQTTRQEDMAYCLMGLFDVNIPLLYGKGEKAFYRLQLQIMQQSDDESIFAWTQDGLGSGLLASSPANFANSFNINRLEYTPRTPFSMTNKGLHINLEAYDLPIPRLQLTWRSKDYKIKRLGAAPLNCTQDGRVPIIIYLMDVGECHRAHLPEDPPQQSYYVKKRHEFYVRQNVGFVWRGSCPSETFLEWGKED